MAGLNLRFCVSLIQVAPPQSVSLANKQVRALNNRQGVFMTAPTPTTSVLDCIGNTPMHEVEIDLAYADCS